MTKTNVGDTKDTEGRRDTLREYNFQHFLHNCYYITSIQIHFFNV